ncbi:MAG TPA: DEAD/DEAH box helicase [Rhabdochlamydiaceae bacterium]|nr:DEAD/DEAH box helicase [Rhabdochlamydiaceae bacterium]
MNDIKIILSNTHSFIQCPNFEIRKKISDLLSYEAPGGYFARRHIPYWDGRIRLLSKDDHFPTGLYSRVKAFLAKKGIPYHEKDTRTPPRASLTLKMAIPFAPRDYQLEAAKISETEPRGVFLMAVGSGKTCTAAMVIEKKKVPTLFVVPDTGLREQATECFSEWFGENNVTNNLLSKKLIVVSNIQKIMHTDRKVFEKFKMLICDEFHHAAAKSYIKLNQWCKEAYYRYGFTGTFLRADGSDMAMHGVLSNVIYTKTASDLIEAGYLVRPHIHIIKYDTPRRNCDYKTAYNLIVQDYALNKIIADIAIDEIKREKQTLILVRRKQHGEVLAELIPKATYLNGDDPLELREKVKKKFIEKKIPCLIATAIFGEGIDIPSINTLINARFQKTEIQTTQGIGRALRKFPGKEKADVYDFLLTGQKHLQSHSVERIMTYRREKSFKISLKNP